MRPTLLARMRRGSAHIEFALVIPVLVVILFATAEYGWMFFRRGLILDAGRQGCRAGAVVHPTDDYTTIVEDATEDALAAVGVDCATTNCDVTVSTDGDSPRETLQCGLQVDYVGLTGLIPVPNDVTAGYIYHFERQR